MHFSFSSNTESSDTPELPSREPLAEATLLELITDGFVTIDRQWRYTGINRAAERITGIDRADLLGKVVWDVYPDAAHSPFAEHYYRAMETQQPSVFEEYYAPSQRWYRLHLFPSPQSLSILYTDITAQKKTEERLSYLASLAENLHDAVIATDLNYRLVGWNKAAEEMYGWTEKEVLGKPIQDILLADFLSTTYDEAHQHLHEHGFWKGECLQRRKDGTPLIVMATTSLVQTGLGEPLGAISINRDISQQKKVEQALIKQETRFRRIFESNMIGIFFWNIEGQVFEANDAFLDMIGYTRDELQAGTINWKELTPAEYQRQDQQGLELLFSGKQLPHTLEKEYLRKDGSRFPLLIHGTFLDEQHSEGVSFVLDISDRKELERRKDDFIGFASHELKNPLTALKGFVQILHRQLSRQGLESATTSLEKMEGLVDRLTRLINELLDVSKIQSGQLECILERMEVDTFIREVTEIVQQTTKTHSLLITGSCHSWIMGDDDRLEQVIVNLLNNAIKYSPDARRVDILLSSDTRNVSISIRDYGIGIPLQQQDKIFERFYRILPTQQRKISGLGLGLYIAREIIHLHGGDLLLTSEPEKGSTFTVILPIWHSEETNASSPETVTIDQQP
jgi:PAS domain S-box-containing protein